MRKFYTFILIILFEYHFLDAQILANNYSQDQSLEDLLNTTISTASKYEQKVGEAPASVSIITNDDIKLYGYRTLAQILQKETGFFISDDKNYTFVGVRGFLLPCSYNNKLLLLLDGHTINDNVYGGSYYDNEYALDLNNIEKIEIVRGPSSALYGTNALFAVINIITRKAKQIDGIQINANMGSYSTQSVALSVGKELTKDLSISISGKTGRSTGRDYFFDIFNTPDSNYGVSKGNDGANYFGLNCNAEIYKYSINAFYSSHTQHTPTAKYETAFNSKDFEETDIRAFVEIKHCFLSEKNISIDGRSYFDYYKYKAAFPYLTEISREYNLGNSAGIEVQGTWDITDNYRTVVGLQYDNNFTIEYETKDADSTNLMLSDPYSLFSIYWNNNWQPTSNLSFILGLRQDFYGSELKSLNPRFGIIYNPIESSTIKLLFGSAFRRPNIYETMYSNDGIQKVSVDLKPERIKTYELVLEQRLIKTIFVSVSLFHNEIENLITMIKDVDNQSIFQNIKEIKANGIEGRIMYKPNPSLSAFANFTYTDCGKPDNKLFISYPSQKITFGANYAIIEDLFIGTNVLYENGRVTYKNSKTPDYFIVDLNAVYTIDCSKTNILKNLRLHLNLDNIFDVRYYHSVSEENSMDRILQSGRNYTFSISFDI